MPVGTKGAIGAALATLGQGVSSAGQMDFQQQMQDRIQTGKDAREANLGKLRHAYRLEEIAASGMEARKTQAVKPVKPAAGQQARLEKLATSAVKAYQENLPVEIELSESELVSDYKDIRNATLKGGDPYQPVLDKIRSRMAGIPEIEEDPGFFESIKSGISDFFSQEDTVPQIKTLSESYDDTTKQLLDFGRNAISKKTHSREDVIKTLKDQGVSSDILEREF